MARQQQHPRECVREVVLGNPAGLHARPATAFVDRATKFNSDVVLIKDGREGNGKSIMEILALGAEQGALLSLVTRGPDARAALEALLELLETKLDET